MYKNRIALIIIFILTFSSIQIYGHTSTSEEGRLDNNVITFMSIYPQTPNPNEKVKLIFSIQDNNGNDLEHLDSNIRIFRNGNIIYDSGITHYELGNFYIDFIFQDSGEYNVEVSIITSSNIKSDVEFPIIIEYKEFRLPLIRIVLTTLLVITVIIFPYLQQSYLKIRKSNRRINITQLFVLKGLIYIITGITLIDFANSQWIISLEDRNLAYHMFVEHFFYIFSSITLSYGIEYLIIVRKKTKPTSIISLIHNRIVKINNKYNKKGIITSAIITLLLVYWHIPTNFNLTAIDNEWHILMHIFLSIVGLLIYLDIKSTTQKGLLIKLIILMNMMLIIGFTLILTESHYYTNYIYDQQSLTGILMAIPHPFILMIIIVHFIFRYLWERER